MSEETKKQLTYADAGVNIDAGNEAVELMKASVQATYRPEVIGDIGGFGGLFALNSDKYKEPVLVSGTDGVGTKLKLAFMADKHDTIGQDAVAMCVNDILVQGAEPLFFLDYIAIETLEAKKVAQIVKGVANACKESGCALIGGETAEMSDLYGKDEYDIAGFCVGVVEKSKMITGEKVKPGDVLLGLPSAGVHSNGFTLVRKICFDVVGFTMDTPVEEFGTTLGEELLKPTRLYPRVCLPLIEKFNLHGMVHITGGGFYDNIPRILPENCDADVNAGAWEVPVVFKKLQEWGNVDWHEMYRTFNMGVGMVLVVAPEEADAVREHLKNAGETFYELGTIIEGSGKAVLKGGVFGE
mgnify:FL=1